MSSHPVRRAPLWGAMLFVGLAAMAMGATLFWGHFRLAVTAALGAAGLWMVLAWACLRLSPSDAWAARLFLGGSAVAGVLDVYGANWIVGFGSSGDGLVQALMSGETSGVWASVIFGAPPGLVFGALSLLPIRRAHVLIRDPAIETTDRVLRVTGAWLAAVATVCSAMMGYLVVSLDQPWATRGPVLAGAGTIALLGLAVSTATHLRVVGRRRWFERVQSGKDPGWTIVPRSFFVEELDGLPPLFAAAPSHNVVLVQHDSVATGGAYRTASNLVPYAFVHLPEGLAALSFSLPSDEDRQRASRA